MRNCKQALYTNSERLNHTLINYHSLSLWLAVTPQPSQDDLPISFHSVCAVISSMASSCDTSITCRHTPCVPSKDDMCRGSDIATSGVNNTRQHCNEFRSTEERKENLNTIENAGQSIFSLPIIINIGHIIREWIHALEYWCMEMAIGYTYLALARFVACSSHSCASISPIGSTTFTPLSCRVKGHWRMCFEHNYYLRRIMRCSDNQTNSSWMDRKYQNHGIMSFGLQLLLLATTTFNWLGSESSQQAHSEQYPVQSICSAGAF